MPTGDYAYFKRIYSNRSVDVDYATSDSTVTAITVKSANHQLFIQKVSWNVVTSAAQAVTLKDSGVPKIIGVVPASQTTPIVFDFGPEGIALAKGKNFLLASTAGPAGAVHIEAYEKLGGAIAAFDRSNTSSGTTQ